MSSVIFFSTFCIRNCLQIWCFSDPLALYMEDICTVPVNLIGAPSISIPVGFKDGMPLGMQLIGPTLGEEKILQAAYTFEQDHPEFTKTAPKGEFE